MTKKALTPADEAKLDATEARHSLTAAERKSAADRRELNLTRTRLRQAEADVKALEESLSIVRGIEHVTPDPPKWMAPAPSGKHLGTPLLIMADNHFDEIVRPEEIMGLNAYNRKIAVMRLRKTFEGAIILPERYIGTSLKHDGIVVAHAGDLLTGEIHDELTETNEAKPTETIEFFIDPMIAGFDMLLDAYGKVHVVVVSGNHDRLYRKYRAKGQARTSWAWLFWKTVARHYASNPKITFTIPDGNSTIFGVYDTRFLLHHGEGFRGGGGIAGPLTPLALGQKRKLLKHVAGESYTGNESLRFDQIIQGHVHHRNSIPGLITVGAAKGFDEYADSKDYPYEPPSQELLVVTPERGITFGAAIWLQDRKAEGW